MNVFHSYGRLPKGKWDAHPTTIWMRLNKGNDHASCGRPVLLLVIIPGTHAMGLQSDFCGSCPVWSGSTA